MEVFVHKTPDTELCIPLPCNIENYFEKKHLPHLKKEIVLVFVQDLPIFILFFC